MAKSFRVGMSANTIIKKRFGTHAEQNDYSGCIKNLVGGCVSVRGRLKTSLKRRTPCLYPLDF